MPKKKYKSAPQTQENKLSETDYNWVITFVWDTNQKNPFEVYQRCCFSGREIPIVWYEKILSKDCRYLKQKLSGLGGKEYSVFCKVELGK